MDWSYFWLLIGGNALATGALAFLMKSLVEKKLKEQQSRFEHTLKKESDLMAQTHDLRLAALDERLKAHQEAYALFMELYWKVHQQDKGDTVSLAYKWWNEHCLYLSEPARSAFRAGINDIVSYNDYKNSPEQMPAWDRINKVFKHLEEGVGLPSIGVTPPGNSADSAN